MDVVVGVWAFDMKAAVACSVPVLLVGSLSVVEKGPVITAWSDGTAVVVVVVLVVVVVVESISMLLSRLGTSGFLLSTWSFLRWLCGIPRTVFWHVLRACHSRVATSLQSFSVCCFLVLVVSVHPQVSGLVLLFAPVCVGHFC